MTIRVNLIKALVLKFILKKNKNIMKTGRIKMWDISKGYGFIEDDDGWDYFLNISHIRSGQIIREGDRVKFDVFEGQRGPSAENVCKI